MFVIWNQRDLGNGDNAFGPVVAAALAGGLGISIYKTHPDDAGSNVVTKEDTKELGLKPEVTDNKPMQVEVTDIEKRDVDMEAMFHDWMKRVGRVYPNQEERKRFEVFKETVKKTAPRYERASVPYIPKIPWADRTHEEIREMRRINKRVDHDQYLEEEEAWLKLLKKREQMLLQKMKKEGNLDNCSKQ